MKIVAAAAIVCACLLPAAAAFAPSPARTPRGIRRRPAARRLPVLPHAVQEATGSADAGTGAAASDRRLFLSTSSAAAVGACLPSAAGAVASPDVPRYVDSEVSMQYGEASGGAVRPGLVRRVPVRRYTGENTPYVPRAVPVPLRRTWPPAAPWREEDFFRADQQDDGSFYAVPRFSDGADEPGTVSIVDFYRRTAGEMRRGGRRSVVDVLDLCAGWTSHFPREWAGGHGSGGVGRLAGLGMNAAELSQNSQLTEWLRYNVNNEEPTLPYNFPVPAQPRGNILPYGDKSFDLVTLAFGIEYLVDPVGVLADCRRVLRKGGRVVVVTNQKYFPSKATGMWLFTNQQEHLELINAFFQYAVGYGKRKAYDITADGPNAGTYEPVFVVEAMVT